MSVTATSPSSSIGVGLSKTLLSQVFGNEFASSLFESYEKSSKGVQRSPSSKEFLHPSPAKSHLIADNDDDGPSKPKAPRTEDISKIVEEDKEFAKGAVPFVDHLGNHMRLQLQRLEEDERQRLDSIHTEGRLGPGVVKMDVESHVGSFIISTDRLGVSSQCNFGSVRACTCVFKGKWQFEAQIGSNGVMQIGWSTLETKFSQEKGVGDTIDSYAYDGNRLRKWNKTSSQYGQMWQAGDIIGCCINLDEGTVEFSRNGTSLGVAFTNIRRGPSIAYFPAVSLAYQENIILNFGATPLQFPVEGYSPMQAERVAENLKSSLILSWLEGLLPLYSRNKFDVGPEEKALLIITNRIMEFLCPHFHSGFFVTQFFYPFFAKILGLPPLQRSDTVSSASISTLKYDKGNLVLDIMWSLLEEGEVKSCIERLCVVLLNQFRSNSMSLEYPLQKYSLLCLIALTKHRMTRRYLIRNLMLDRSGRLIQFLHICPLDEAVLKSVLSDPWWPNKSPENSAHAIAYNQACSKIEKQVAEVQTLQVAMLKILLSNDDGTDKRPSSRAIFLRKFRSYTRDVIRPGSVIQQPMQKAMCSFFCFLKAIGDLYFEDIDASEPTVFKLPDFPSSLFYDTSLSYFEMERVGGLASYLYKTHHLEVCDKLSIPEYVKDKPASPALPSGSTDPSPGPDNITNPAGIIHVTTAMSTMHDDIRRSMEFGGHGTNIIITREGISAGPIPPPMPHPPLMPIEERIGGQDVGGIPNGSGSRVASNTSSNDTIVPGAAITQFNALLAGTPSGHNMLIPMMAEFRQFDQGGLAFLPGGFLGFANVERRPGVIPQNPAVALLGKDSGSVDPAYSLRELLDDAIIIFNSGVQSNIEKVVSLRTTTEGYEEALKCANSNLASASNPGEKQEIMRSIEIFTKKLEEQARHMAWIKSAVFTKERQLYTYALLKIVLQTLKRASAEGVLFTFVPEHYITTLVNLNWLILNQMHPTVPYTNISDLPETLREVAEFVATHLADPRIVIAETKDALTQALSTYICNQDMLRALEEMPKESQITMVKAILRPYENRAWAQSNWMLVRIWQGDGFVFQYPNSAECRRSYRAKPVQDEFGISTNLPPRPSKIFQRHVAEVLLQDQKFAVAYLHSVLNQLNWAFSEFVGLLQEIQTAANRPERVFIESRQLRICCTCFELTQALLRVMEMVVTIASPILMDFTRESAEPLLSRLSMLISQILNRAGSTTGCFASVVDLDIPGLENVTHFPLLSAVAGIIIALIQLELEQPDSQVLATKSLLSEPSFQLNSLECFLGRSQDQADPFTDRSRAFSFKNYVPTDVTEAEIKLLQEVINHLYTWSEKLQSDTVTINDDDICTICYAFSKNATLKPCNHRTCKTCILHHLMNKGECFFCKATIQQVFLDDGTKIYDAPPNDEHVGDETAHLI